jgi:hypothetical protein
MGGIRTAVQKSNGGSKIERRFKNRTAVQNSNGGSKFERRFKF